ncbi:MAG: MarC family protein [Planctomycetes bacterium]|nr:MarC family protein [Planctomycetota bacterium]
MSLAMLPRGGIEAWAGPIGLVIHHSLLLFAVVNPIGNIPVYADLTRDLHPRERRRVMNLAVLTALGVVVVFTLIGDWSLSYLFNVTVNDLQIAGGILLFIIAVRGIMPHGDAYQNPKDRMMVAVFPIAFPIMVGPGALTVTIITTQGIGQGLMVITAVVTFFFVFLIARNAHALTRLMGPYVGTMIARLLYIFLAAKAVAMVLHGLSGFLGQFFPRLHTLP